MLSAEEYARAKELMCNGHSFTCSDCCLYGHSEKNRPTMMCSEFIIKYPAEAVKLVELWWKENKKDLREGWQK